MKNHRYSNNAQINKLVKLLIRQGYVYQRGKKHGKILSPNGKRRISIPSTPSDWRAPRQFKAEVLRNFKYRR